MTSPLAAAHAAKFIDRDSACLADIRRELMAFQVGAEFRGKANRVPLRQFAQLCGISRQTLYDIARSDRKALEPHTRDAILAAIKLIRQGGLRWKRIAVRKAVVERRVITPGLIEWRAVMPDGSAPPPIPPRQYSQAQLDHHADRKSVV